MQLSSVARLLFGQENCLRVSRTECDNSTDILERVWERHLIFKTKMVHIQPCDALVTFMCHVVCVLFWQHMLQSVSPNL